MRPLKPAIENLEFHISGYATYQALRSRCLFSARIQHANFISVIELRNVYYLSHLLPSVSSSRTAHLGSSRLRVEILSHEGRWSSVASCGRRHLAASVSGN